MGLNSVGLNVMELNFVGLNVVGLNVHVMSRRAIKCSGKHHAMNCGCD